MSRRSVWAFKMGSRRRVVVTIRTDQTGIFYRACEMKQWEGDLYQKLMNTN